MINDAAFLLVKVVGWLTKVDVILLTTLVAGVAFIWFGHRRIGAVLALVTAGAFVLVATLPLGAMLLAPLERPYEGISPPAHVDGIVVLGGGITSRSGTGPDQWDLNSAGDRLTMALWLARQFPAARLIASGGDANVFPASPARPEADAMKDFLVWQGIAEGRIQTESQSRNTAENASLTLAIAAPAKGETWVLVTSAYHMDRALRAFSRAGWPTIKPIATDFRSIAPAFHLRWNLPDNLDLLNLAVREWAGKLDPR
jgi:uncharacterized SAM-binding protein YcdF (DUF218 family)